MNDLNTLKNVKYTSILHNYSNFKETQLSNSVETSKNISINTSSKVKT